MSYTKQLMSSGRTDAEIVGDLEAYYNQLCTNCDQEILRLREELEIVQAEERTALADDLVVPRSELDNLSNFFLDCVYAQRKSLRQKLLKIKSVDNSINGPIDNELGSIMSNGQPNAGRQNKLLETYMRIVKTGAPDEIEQFSKIER